MYSKRQYSTGLSTEGNEKSKSKIYEKYGDSDDHNYTILKLLFRSSVY